MKLKYLGHSGFYLSDGKTKVVIDPFLTQNPLSGAKVEELEADFLFISHAHSDHMTEDGLTLSKKGATLVSSPEIAAYTERQGAKTHGANIGGTFRFPGGWVKFFPAWHSSSFTDGTYGGMPMGMVVELDGFRIYHAGDTALFSDMKLIGDHAIDLALLPIGDNFTMGPEDALKALELIRPHYVVPIHYNTFPLIQQDGAAFAQAAESQGVQGRALKPGETWEF